MDASSRSPAAAIEHVSTPTTPGFGYCRLWFILVLVLIAATGAINALIDPFLVVGAPRIIGLNAAKPETKTHTQLAKDHLVERVRPAGVVLGDSKVDIGINPNSPSWPEDARQAFNYGVPGTGLDDAIADLRHAMAVGKVARALVLIELEEFMAPEDTNAAAPPEPAPSGLQVVNQNASDFLLATLSLDALWASAVTVASQHDPNVVDLSPAGATGDGGFRSIVATDGYDTVFLQKDGFLVSRFAALAASLRAYPNAGMSELGSLGDLMALCRRQGIKLDLAIAPYHADYLDALDQAGLWQRYELAKTALTRLVVDQGGGMVRLWDFLGYDAYSTESVPGPSDRSGSTRWFWEPSHFKRALGERILATVYRGGQEYGVQLTSDMIDAHLHADTQAKAAYRARASASPGRLARATQ